ncbi:MAG TPA: nuclear transport factor 2 family protein [Solirubrobacterales bacterium]|nr:nuclear transport factor 2 family protein [Solirubrobacterales bacterium]
MRASTPLHKDPVREFIRAFNERDLDAFVAVLDPEVEIHSMKGLVKGVEGARLWATRKRGGVQQTIDLEQLYEGGTEADGRAVALIMRRWHWDEGGDHAGEDAMAWMFELREHRIRSWRPFEDRAEALRRAGFARSPRPRST